jgi:hypothetical protein
LVQLAAQTRVTGATPEHAVQILTDTWATMPTENVRNAWLISKRQKTAQLYCSFRSDQSHESRSHEKVQVRAWILTPEIGHQISFELLR